eukprot:14427196-Alexandrium_andersonii.AAC.1
MPLPDSAASSVQQQSRVSPGLACGPQAPGSAAPGQVHGARPRAGQEAPILLASQGMGRGRPKN